MIIGTAGHVDHGKTALVKALTGIDTDRLPEEKKRGITLELGFAPIDLEGFGAASLIDVPGHEDFVKTMISGAAGIDVGLLVIAADEGIMPQTREHFAILRLLGVPHLVIALTKSDLVDAEWLALLAEEVRALLSDSRWTDAAIVSCSAVTRAGLDELRTELTRAARAVARRNEEDLFRLPVDRSFTVKGTGTVVTGSVWSGSIARDSEIRLLPSAKTARVRRLHRHGAEVDRVGAGDRAAIALTGVDVSEVPRGSVLVGKFDWHPTKAVDAWIELADEREVAIRPSTMLRFQLAGADVAASPVTKTPVGPGFSGLARLKLEDPVAARGGDRFILRLPAPVGTIGGGVVVDPFPEQSFSSASKTFSAASAHDPCARVLALLDSAGGGGLEIAELTVRLGCAPAEVGPLLEQCGARIGGGLAFTAEHVNDAKKRLIDALVEAERTFPLGSGVQLESLRTSLDCKRELVALAVADLSEMGEVVGEAGLVRRLFWRPEISATASETIESLVHAICASGKEPPSVLELEEKFGSEVAGLLRYLEREGQVVQVETNRFYARGAVDDLVATLREKLQPGVEYEPSQLRELLGFSRKYLIPFLEYCDRAGITERRAGGRSLGRERSFLTHR